MTARAVHTITVTDGVRSASWTVDSEGRTRRAGPARDEGPEMASHSERGPSATDIITASGLTLDTGLGTVSYGEARTKISPMKARILSEMMRRPGRVVRYDYLLGAIYPGPDGGPDNAEGCIQVQVCLLRQSLAKIGAAGLLGTVWGTGFVLKNVTDLAAGDITLSLSPSHYAALRALAVKAGRPELVGA